MVDICHGGLLEDGGFALIREHSVHPDMVHMSQHIGLGNTTELVEH
jgi:hypothetical protein